MVVKLNNWAVDLIEAKVVVEPKPINRVELVNFLPQDDLNYMLECINKGFEELEATQELEKLGEGCFGTVFGYKNYAIKINRDKGHNKSYSETLDDGAILKSLQHVSSVMKLYAIVDNNAMISERVDGMMVQEYLERGYQDFISPHYKDIYEEDLKKILYAGWNAEDLHNKNVMISRITGLAVIVDVGFFKKNTDMNSYKSHNEINLNDYWNTRDALIYSSKMDKYVNIKKEELKREELEKSKIVNTDNFHPMVIRELELNLHIA